MASNGEIARLVSNPVRMRVLITVGGQTLTTKQLRDALPDIAQATLYRHIAALVDGGFLTVVDERPVRGTVERSYALGERMAHVDEQEMATMDAAQLRSAFLSFLRMLGENFEEAVEQETAEDRWVFGFGHTNLYLSEDELQRLQQALTEQLARYQTAPTGDEPERRRRVLLSTALLAQETGRS